MRIVYDYDLKDPKYCNGCKFLINLAGTGHDSSCQLLKFVSFKIKLNHGLFIRPLECIRKFGK